MISPYLMAILFIWDLLNEVEVKLDESRVGVRALSACLVGDLVGIKAPTGRRTPNYFDQLLNMPPTFAATSPSPLSPPPPIALSICPAIGAGNFVFRKPSTVVTAVRA